MYRLYISRKTKLTVVEWELGIKPEVGDSVKLSLKGDNIVHQKNGFSLKRINNFHNFNTTTAYLDFINLHYENRDRNGEQLCIIWTGLKRTKLDLTKQIAYTSTRNASHELRC